MSASVEMLPIVKIGTKGRLRHDDHGYVDTIAASVQRAASVGVGYDGLRHPIEVRREESGYLLISGLHRLMALHRLERDEVAAVVLDVDEIEARLLEVEENLVRRDLDALDRAAFVLRFREMFEAAYGVVSRGGDQKSAEIVDENQRGNLHLWSEDAQERLGLSEDSIKRCLRIANGLTDATVEALRGTQWARNQSALLALAAVPPEKQPAVVDALFADTPASTMGEAIDLVLGNKRDVPKADRWVIKFSSSFQKQKKVQQDRMLRELIGIVGRDRIQQAFAELDLAPLDDGAE